MNLSEKNRASKALGSPRKRFKPNSEEVKDKNWTLACVEVSGNEYFDYRARFQLVYLPSCIPICNHGKYNGSIKQMPTYAEESFYTEIRNHMWYDALEVCHMSITPTQYLSCDVLQEIVEIILNVHEDRCSDYTAKYIIDNCQQTLFQNFSTHPPCQDNNLRNCYVKFLTSSMPDKKNTYTNRINYEYNLGIVKYCLNRLESELSTDSKDGPIVDKNIPENLKGTVQGFHWIKQNYEIFESLNREERIKRLFAVLETIIEVLQFDLAIQQSRYLDDQSCQIRCNKLMEHVLGPQNKNGHLSGTCRQIIRIFANVVHLQYPDAMVKTITMWLNSMIQTIYCRETHSNTDYPNISKNCIEFAQEFYKIIAELPHDSFTRILERIEPSYIRHIVGLFYLNKILSVNEGCIIKILKDFLCQSQWKLYSTKNVEIKLSKELFNPPKRVYDKMSYLLSKCTVPISENNNNSMVFPKKDIKLMVKTEADLHHIVHTLYITLDASLDANKLQSVQDTWNALNKQILNGDLLCTYNCYSVSDALECRYKYNLKAIKELASLFNDLINQGQLPLMFNIFGNIRLLELHI
ncbi:unnamed protein product [Arctia plantaginis]|uniref:Uncharacterized protein n=1 Tax=Arctia plantaginis TaxID=874455 RepID=A0A8S1AC61_ARCPL|nr:unnamed protein product [Arctia plantaginis]